MNLYYEAEQNGYHIKDHDNPDFHIHCYNPYEQYVADKTLSNEENAQAHIKSIMIDEYFGELQRGEITLEDVPEEYREDVSAKWEEARANMRYTLDEAAAITAEEVADNEA